MNESKITVHVRFVNAATCVIDIIGDIDSAAEQALQAAYSEANRRQVKIIALNFGKLNYMNSTGIGLLVTLLVRAQREGRKLVAFDLSEHYQRIFCLTRLDEAIPLYQDESTATAMVPAQA